jgi:hypothetical protein
MAMCDTIKPMCLRVLHELLGLRLNPGPSPPCRLNVTIKPREGPAAADPSALREAVRGLRLAPPGAPLEVSL